MGILGFLNFFREEEPFMGGLLRNLALWIDSSSAEQAMWPPEPITNTRRYVLKSTFVREFAQSRLGALRYCRAHLQRADAYEILWPGAAQNAIGEVGGGAYGADPPT